MKKYVRLGVISFATLILFFTLPFLVDAHKSTCKTGSEKVGYVVKCTNGHAGTKNITYKYATGLGASYKGYASTGAARWNNAGATNIKYSSSSKNVVTSYGGPDSGTVAYLSSTYNTSTGHITKWTMNFNRYVMGSRTASKNNGTATHEFGHAIGLKDLYQANNKGAIMYGTSSRTVTTPQFSDVTGAREAVK